MKKCPQCNRTYADEGFTFCLEDGTLLSPPYDPKSEEPISTIVSSEPPSTAVLPNESSPARDSHRQDNTNRGSELPPTIASPAPLEPGSSSQHHASVARKKKFKPLRIAIALVILAVVVL